ncbi:MAG: AI-2E family transporter [Dehalococcoidia bacterium]|nr:AI-2E family transporter [Dehalococcoidia bacterium]
MGRAGFTYAPSLILAGVVLLGLVLTVLLVLAVYEILLVVFLGVVLGVALSPVATVLERFRIPRALSVLAVYVVVGAVIGVFAWYTVPRVTDELGAMSEDIRTLQAEYDELAGGNDLPSIDEILAFVETRVGDFAPSLFSQAFLVVALLAYFVVVLAVGVFYSVVERPAHRVILSLVDVQHRERAGEVMSILARKLRRFVAGELIAMTVIGTITYFGLLLIGIPFPFTLAVIAFLMELLPLVGPWISFVPAIAVAATQGWEAMLMVSVFYLLLQQLEGHVITPLVQNRQTELPALVILVAILVGGALAGLLGALAALPLAIVVQTAVVELLIPWRRRQVQRAARETETGVAQPQPATPERAPASARLIARRRRRKGVEA